MMRAVVFCAAVVVAACGQDKIEVRPGDATDYNRASVMAAVDAFVAAGRTPAAYATLSQAAFQLRDGMDKTVADETELKLMVLALGPVEALQGKSMAERTEALALTVWPTLLAPAFEVDGLLVKRDASAALMMPNPGEDARAYVVRLCGAQLASECKQVVPEQQGAIVGSIAVRRATERARNAVSACMMCGTDPGWHEAVRSWENIDREASSLIDETQRRADPDNWPVAGSAAEADSQLPEVEFSETGELIVAGKRHRPAQRIAALREARCDGTSIALHLRPTTSLAQVRGVLADVKKSGAERVAVVARSPRYPWDRKIYWIADGSGTQTGLRSTDSLQLLLHAVDAVGGPGAIARVD